jgi:hypothetical protein
MDIQPTFSFLFSPGLSDEAAYEIAEFLPGSELGLRGTLFRTNPTTSADDSSQTKPSH